MADLVDRLTTLKIPFRIEHVIRGELSGETSSDTRENRVERIHLKYRSQKGSTKFYGFVLDNNYIVIALQETNWTLALVKPYNRRLVVFHNFSMDQAYQKAALRAHRESEVQEGKYKPLDMEGVVRGSNTEERLANLFSSQPTVRKVKKLMYLVSEFRDNDSFGDRHIDLVKQYYTL